MTIENKSIKLWPDEKNVLTEALINARNSFQPYESERLSYDYVIERLNSERIINGCYYLDVCGGGYCVCITALRRVLKYSESWNERRLAEKILNKIIKAPNKPQHDF